MDTDECLSYLEKVIHTLTEIPYSKKRSCFDLLDRIKRRKSDPNLNAAIIGDFSSGKSTFINAFLQRDLLKTAWKATTAIPTHIFYHNKEQTTIVIHGIDGYEYNLDKDEDKALLEKKLGISLSDDDKSIIATLSATNRFADVISTVYIYVSSSSDLKNICIIDTPGVNPGESSAKNHIQQTQKVLREYADLTIILYQSMRVLANSFNLFLDENASHFMDEAVFVITMMDMPDEDERGTILEYAENGLRERFNIDDPKLFGCSAIYADPGAQGMENEQLKREFDGLRSNIIGYMHKRRSAIIERQISKLLRDLIEELKGEIETYSGQIKNRLDTLRKNSIENLRSQMNSIYSQYSKRLDQKWNSIGFLRRYNAMFDRITANARSQLLYCRQIRGDDIMSITGYMTNYLPLNIKSSRESFSKELAAETESVNKIISDYYRENRELFESFSINLGHSKKTNGRNIDKLNYDKEIGEVGYIDESMVELLGLTAGVVVALPFVLVDAVLGTDIGDTIVKAVNGLRNGLINRFADLQSRKKKAIAAVETSMKKQKDENRDAFLQSVYANKEKINRSMKNTEEFFSKKYRAIYAERKQIFAKEKKSLEEKIKTNTEMLVKMEDYLKQLK